MRKIQALTAYLLDRQLVLPEQLQSWVEQMDSELIWKETERGLHMGDMTYRAIFDLERFTGSPSRLLALVGTWLEANDPDREDLPAPAFVIEPIDLDNELFDVELTLQFVEPQYLAEDDDGEFQAFGKTWAFVPYDLWIAEEGEAVARG
ncbi:phage tail protein [Pseudomonas monteilii]|uniref:phage tail protein n=1 Tax=Pseudomonas TaxID=286 RepID=UPI000EFA5A81|nr:MULTISPECIES: phage tail protein [Pseudomonas]AYO02555.1 phage tail protein [Pseudomonas sp. LTGT-11-2Z]MCE0927887.1 phage tail protein [Pseudomonas monteilii]MCT8188299.1 phage tail protein [Pseudomonas monteilii]UPK83786.1 phage tail protein [Pseudomonas sp. A2]WJN88614.1 phage tail protein [Pseudomonas monteilii]